MHVPLILAMINSDVSLLLRTVQELISVTPDLAILQPENVYTHLLYVTITTHVPLMSVTRQPENANTLQRTVTMKTHVPLTAVTKILDCASMLLKYVTMKTYVPETLAM
jgi:hypothetical protein